MNEFERELSFHLDDKLTQIVRSLEIEELPSFSVVIPSFNQGEFIGDTLQSVLDQAYPKMEIYVADGGSTDNTCSILEGFKSRYPNIITYDSRPDGGHYQGVNKGIANTKNDIIAWINSDDLYLPDAFWKVATFFYFNRMAFVVYGRNRYVQKNLEPLLDYPVDWSPLIAEQRRRMMHFCIVPQPSLFFHRNAVRLSGALKSPILDYELWMRWQKDLPFYFLNDYLSLSRLHEKAITANASNKLLHDICSVVHEYYGCVPYSWAYRYAYNRRYGAAWTRGESPEPDFTVKVSTPLYWIYFNAKWSMRLLVRTVAIMSRSLSEASKQSS